LEDEHDIEELTIGCPFLFKILKNHQVLQRTLQMYNI